MLCPVSSEKAEIVQTTMTSTILSFLKKPGNLKIVHCPHKAAFPFKDTYVDSTQLDIWAYYSASTGDLDGRNHGMAPCARADLLTLPDKIANWDITDKHMAKLVGSNTEKDPRHLACIILTVHHAPSVFLSRDRTKQRS